MIALKSNPDKAPKPDYYEKSIHKVLTIGKVQEGKILVSHVIS